MSDELPNPFLGLPSDLIGLDGAPEFLLESGWGSELGISDDNEKAMYATLWDVAYAHGRAAGQIEGSQPAKELLDAKQKRVEDLETALARAEDDAKGKAETFWESRVRELEGKLETARLRNDSALAALQRTKDRLDDLKAEVAIERAERKIGFRLWWRLDRLAASAGQVTHSKLASYTDD